jgi:general secretion pathway protein C
VPAPQQRVAIAAIFTTLALVAFFTAHGTSGLLGGVLIELDPTSVPTPTGPAALPRAQERRDPMPILARNIFDRESGPLDGSQVEEAPPETATAPPEPIDPNNIPACDGAARLVGAVRIDSQPHMSFASVVGASGRPSLFRPGMQIDGRELVEVEHWRVLLRPTDGRLCQLAMFREAPAGASPPMAANANLARPPVTVTPMTPPEMEDLGGGDGSISQSDLESGISRVSDTEYNVNRDLVNNILENQAELMRTARVIPHEINGRVVGVKLYGIRRNSLLGRLGLQNGDMLRTINGFDMASPDSALEAYARLRNADHLSVSVIRRGTPMTIDYNVR